MRPAGARVVRTIVKRLLFVAMLAACEKSGPIESTPGASNTSAPEAPKPIVVEPKTATLENAASIKAKADDAKAKADAEAKAKAEAARKERDRKADAMAKAMQDEAALAMANMLTSDNDARISGDMAQRRPGSDLASQLDNLRGGNRVVIGGGGSRGGRISTGDARVGTGDASNGAKVDTSTPSGRVSVSGKQGFDDTTLTADAVLMKMQSAYFAGLKRCYKTYLAKDPSARGRMKLSLSVNESGRAVSVSAKGFATEIDTCVSGIMASWRFPIPKDKDGEATTASFAFDLQLVPD